MGTGKKSKPILWQPMMARVMYALVPVVAASVYFFGWRSLVTLILVNIAGFLTEYVFCRVYIGCDCSSCFSNYRQKHFFRKFLNEVAGNRT